MFFCEGAARLYFSDLGFLALGTRTSFQLLLFFLSRSFFLSRGSDRRLWQVGFPLRSHEEKGSVEKHRFYFSLLMVVNLKPDRVTSLKRGTTFLFAIKAVYEEEEEK